MLPDYFFHPDHVIPVSKFIPAFSVKLTEEDIAFLEEPYVPHRIVGAVDSNPPEGTKLLDVKK